MLRCHWKALSTSLHRELALQLESVHLQGEDPTASISSQLLSLQESRGALELRIRYLQTQNAKLLTQIGKLKAIVQQVNLCVAWVIPSVIGH